MKKILFLLAITGISNTYSIVEQQGALESLLALRKIDDFGDQNIKQIIKPVSIILQLDTYQDHLKRMQEEDNRHFPEENTLLQQGISVLKQFVKHSIRNDPINHNAPIYPLMRSIAAMQVAMSEKIIYRNREPLNAMQKKEIHRLTQEVLQAF